MPASAYPDRVLRAQSTFRSILDAVARPGCVQPLDEIVDPPAPLSAGAGAIALTLCDHDTPVWLDAALRGNEAVSQWLRFHCGCPITEKSGEAAFAFVSDPRQIPTFDEFNLGSADYPDRSTTIVLQVESLENGTPLKLVGPGIRGQAFITADPLPADMAARLAFNRALFPRGVDLLLVTPRAVVGLPRSLSVVEN